MDKQWQIFINDDLCEYFDNRQQAISFLSGILQMFPKPMELEIAIYERNEEKTYTMYKIFKPIYSNPLKTLDNKSQI